MTHEPHESARRKSRRGNALVFTLVILTGLMMLGSGYVVMATRGARTATAAVDESRAFHLAEAALAESMMALRAEAAGLGNVGSPAQPAYVGGGVLWVTSTALGPNTYRLVATGMAGSGRASIEAVVELDSKSPLFVSVLNSQDPLTLNSSVIIDSYASMAGTYASQAINSWSGIPYALAGGDVSSNANIALNSGAIVFGDATPGPGYAVSLAAGSYVAGTTSPGSTPMTFPAIEVPSVASAGAYSLADLAVATLPAGSYGFDDFTLGKAATLTVAGPSTIVVKNFVGGKLARLKIDATAGPVTIYVQGNFSPGADFQAEPVAGSPMAVAFMIEGSSDITFPAGSQVRGAYYAPNANVLFTSTNEVWGAIAAHRIDMSSATRFHYDESLADYWKKDSGAEEDPLHLLLWRRGVLGPAAGAGERTDPFQVLGVAKSELLSPAASW